MKLKTAKNTLIGVLTLPLLFATANSAYAIEATYLCPSPVTLQIINAPDHEDRLPMKYSGVMTGKVTGFDPGNPKTDVMWDNVPMAGQSAADTNLLKIIQEQNSIRQDNIKTEGATLAADKVFCEYRLPEGRNFKIATARNLLIPPVNCRKIQTAEGLSGFHCKK